MSLITDLINLNFSEHTEKIIAEYIWIGGNGMDLRSKTRILSGPISDPKKVPKWNCKESSTGQAPGEDSEVVLYPEAVFKDPLRRGKNILVICEVCTKAGVPVTRKGPFKAAPICPEAAEEPWYGIEQEYTLLQKDVQWPIGWPVTVFPASQELSYCSAGVDTQFGRDVADSFCKGSLYAGINIGWIDGDVFSGKWKFQVGSDDGISAGYELGAACYILERTALIAGAVVSFNPNPMQSDSYGAGTLTNYSTRSRRSDCGLFDVIKKGVDMLGNAFSMGDAYSRAVKKGAANRGVANRGVANRGASIHVGHDAGKAGKVKLE